MNLFKHFFFLLRQRRAGNRVPFSPYLKGHEKIAALGRGCKIQADASVDATRSLGVRFGDKVEVSRYAYVQGGNGGVRMADRVRLNNFAIVNGTGGVDIGEDVPAHAVVAGVPATIRKCRE